MNAAGERNHHSKLTADEVMEIRRIWANNMTLKEIAALYNVSRPTVAGIVNQYTWKHLPSVTDIINRRDV